MVKSETGARADKGAGDGQRLYQGDVLVELSDAADGRLEPMAFSVMMRRRGAFRRAGCMGVAGPQALVAPVRTGWLEFPWILEVYELIGTHYRDWPFDDSQERVMMDESRLVTIRGGAGSGRTHVLLARCFKLLLIVGVPTEQMQVLVSSPRAAERARQVLAGAGGCRVDTVPQFCARVVRQAQGTGFTLLSDRDAAGLLGTCLAGSWEVMDESRGLRWSNLRDRAAWLLASGGGSGSGWEKYLGECERRELYDRWRIVERAAECLEENPQLAAELRGGPCRHLLADDVHRWGRAARRLLDRLIDDDVRVTLAGDPAQKLDGGRDVLNWFEWVWQGEVSKRQLELCHRSSGAICDLVNRLSRWDIDRVRSWGEDPTWITGATPVESEAIAAERIAEWMGRGLGAEDVRGH